MSKFCFIYITCPNIRTAKTIANEVVRQKLAACGNILPNMQSVYLWKGKIHNDKEVVLILKTKRSLFKRVEKQVLKLHPYECPCIVEIPLTAGTKKYLQWLQGRHLRT